MNDSSQWFLDRFEQCAPRLHAWSRLHIHPPLRRQLDPEDLVQEVCWRALRNLDRFDPDRGEFSAWLFGIARNVLGDALRRVRARGESAFMASTRDTISRGLDAVAEEATGISTRVVRRDDVIRFLELIDALDEASQRLLIYRGLEGRPHSEVAALLNIEVGTAEKRWQRLSQELHRNGSKIDL